MLKHFETKPSTLRPLKNPVFIVQERISNLNENEFYKIGAITSTKSSAPKGKKIRNTTPLSINPNC